MKIHQLSAENELKAQLEYWELYLRSGYKAKRILDVHTGSYREIGYKDIEVCDFSLSNGDYGLFKKSGLGIITLINEDECKKVLMSLAGQVMVWHSHVSVLVIPPGCDIPRGFVDINERVNEFVGLKNEFPADYRCLIQEDIAAGDFAVPEELKSAGVKIKGKEEAFRFHHGAASLWISCEEGKETKEPVRPIPEEHNQVLFAREFVFRVGDIVHLPTNTFHLIIGGPGGAVFSESSTTSRDELDVFLHPDIVRVQ